MKTILILLDTVKKDYLNIYNPLSDVNTPNIDLLASDSAVFENHTTGSLPCMPARRDLMTGRLDFMERFWGGMEPFDLSLPKELSLAGVKTHMTTDHQHYFKFGGEGYVQYFDTWEFFRGQESDAWVSHVDSYQMPEKVNGRYNKQFEFNKSKFLKIDEYPTMQTFNNAVEYCELHKDEESFFMVVEGFDPHEPFHSPKEFLDMYDVIDDGELYNSPAYGKCTDTDHQLKEIIKKYKANLSFADYAVGKLINKLKDLGIYDECNIIFTSDHGFNLGEHGCMGKGVSHIYNEVSSIPLVIKTPNSKTQVRYSQITQNIDLFPTIFEQYNLEVPNSVHGRSLNTILTTGNGHTRDVAISGYFGQSVLVKDAEYTFYKAPADESCHPLNIYTAMPTMMKGYLGGKYSLFPLPPEAIDIGRFLNHTNYPVFKIPFSRPGHKNPMSGDIFEDELYLNTDNYQLKKLDLPDINEKFKEKLNTIMQDMKVPEDNYVRLGLNKEKNE